MKHDSSKLALVIPALNEEGRIGGVVASVKEQCPDACCLVVDDGSVDGTVGEARSRGAVVLRHVCNLGYGAALQTGAMYCLGEGYDYVVFLDGDGQHDPRSVPVLLASARRGQGDVVIGSRFLEDCGYHAPFLRRCGMALFGSLVILLTGKRCTDPTSGFQCINREAMRFYASDWFPVDYPDANLLIMLHRAGLRAVEVPVRMNSSTKAESMHSGLRPVAYMYRVLLSLLVSVLRRTPY